MSYFSNQLAICLEAIEMSHHKLAELSGVPKATLHRFRDDDARGPSAEVLGKIIRVFDEREHRAAIVAAHLRDETPRDAHDLVQIVALVDPPRVREEPEAEAICLPGNVQKAFREIQRAAAQDPAVTDWITSTARILRER